MSEQARFKHRTFLEPKKEFLEWGDKEVIVCPVCKKRHEEWEKLFKKLVNGKLPRWKFMKITKNFVVKRWPYYPENNEPIIPKFATKEDYESHRYTWHGLYGEYNKGYRGELKQAGMRDSF